MKIFTLIFFFLFTANANAEWIKVKEYEEETYYLDYLSRKFDKTIVKIKFLVDYKKINLIENIKAQSTVVTAEFDCVAKKIQVKETAIHEEKMGGGLGIAAKIDYEWRQATRAPLDELVRASCKK